MGGLCTGDAQQGVLEQIMKKRLWGSKSRRQSGHQERGTRPCGPLQPFLLHPGLKSRTDAAVHLSLKGQGGMLDTQAPGAEGMSILLRDLSLAGRTAVEPRLDRHKFGVLHRLNTACTEHCLHWPYREHYVHRVPCRTVCSCTGAVAVGTEHRAHQVPWALCAPCTGALALGTMCRVQ
ncbi:hypothetical protein EOD39_13840 [Acipenser ruthenus]|uniref:Uncharacterized protein n=1 Tax=Acipenser ruthenus TaxID=7906 RepID=A0A662YP42_ACIRT|nr:hypothetical protein EOD39_13840 [Acipenser ruthenus]